MREKLRRYVDASHELKQPKRVVKKHVRAGAISKKQTRAIRHWAKENGYLISERGRVHSNVREAFEQAH